MDALRDYDVVYLTDENLKPKERRAANKVYTYRTPTFILMDPDLPASDPTRSHVKWALTHPLRAQQVYDWINEIGRTVADLEERHRPRCVLLHFSLTSVLMWIERNRTPGMLGTVPHLLMYYDPGVPNATVPWLFDGRLRNRGFALYNEKKTSEAVLDSWSEMLSRMSLNGGVTSSDDGLRRTVGVLRGVRHVLCWDSAMTPPLKTLIPGMTADYVGGFVERSKASKAVSFRRLPEDVRGFIERHKSGEERRDLVFVSFGSVSHLGRLRRIAMALAAELIPRNHAVIFHDAAPDRENVEMELPDPDMEPMFLVHRGFVPYDAMVPNVDVVAFAGSLCLQLTCMKHTVPMLMIPLTTEQHFWAKNYEHFTGVEYVTNPSNTASAVKSLIRKRERVAEFLKVVKKNMMATDPKANLRNLVASVIREHARLADGSALLPL